MPILMLLVTPNHEALLEALVRERPDAPREIAVLALRCTQHTAAAVAAALGAAPSEATMQQWRRLPSYVFSALQAKELEPHAVAFVRGQQGPAVLLALVAMLEALPRRAPAGQTPAVHASMQCQLAHAALKLMRAAYDPTSGPTGVTAVEGLVLWCQALSAATASLSAATERCIAELPAGGGTGEALFAHDSWQRALGAWDVAHVQTCALG